MAIAYTTDHGFETPQDTFLRKQKEAENNLKELIERDNVTPNEKKSYLATLTLVSARHEDGQITIRTFTDYLAGSSVGHEAELYAAFKKRDLLEMGRILNDGIMRELEHIVVRERLDELNYEKALEDGTIYIDDDPASAKIGATV